MSSSSPLRSLGPEAAVPLRGRLPRMAEAAVERARLTVVPRQRARTNRVPFVTLVTLLLVGGVVGLLLFNTSMQQASFASTALEAQARSLTAREQSLRTDLEGLRDPQRLAEKATRMGMVLSPANCFLHEGTAKVEGVCLPASAADALPVALPRPAKPPELTPRPLVVQAEPAKPTKPTKPAKPADTARDTTAGSSPKPDRDGRQGPQQSQQPQTSQQSQQSQSPSRSSDRR